MSAETDLKLTILAPERKLIENEPVSEVTITTSEGQIQVLPGHVPMVGILETGRFQYKTGTSSTQGVISSGFLQVSGNKVIVMAETLELDGEINVDRARKAQEAAEKMLREADLDTHAFKKYQLKLQRSLVRQVAGGKDTL